MWLNIRHHGRRLPNPSTVWVHCLDHKGSSEMSSSNRIALFIDGANLYSTAKALGFDIDYRRLLTEFQSLGTLVRAFYYTAIIEDQEYSSIRPLVDWLDYNGYTVVTKAT